MPELADVVQRERVERLELPDAAEVEEDVAGEGALHEPDAGAEPDPGDGEHAAHEARGARQPQPFQLPARQRQDQGDRAGGEHEGERHVERGAEGERQREAGADERHRRGEGGAAVRWPRHRATSAPGSRTTSVAAASRTQSPNPVSGRSREIPSSATAAAGAMRRQTASGAAGSAAGLRSSTAGCASQFMAPCRLRHGAGAQPFPRDDHGSRQGGRDRDEEEEEARREGLVGRDAEGAEEAHEERFPHRKPVDRERHEHDEEEQRPHHVVGPRREIDPDGLAGAPDREHPDRLHDDVSANTPPSSRSLVR